MKTKLLNGTWNLKILGKDAGLTGEAGLPAEVPGSVYATLLTEGKIEDPYYRDNELKTLPIMDNDFCYTTRFEVEPEWFSMDGLFLRFDGIDTLADIYVNQQLLGSAYNMHRSWEYDLLDGDLLKEGTNELQVILHSPTQYIKEENAKVYTGGSHEAMEGFPHLRKAHCMFGWDWGPRVPDAGIYREVSLVGVEKSRIESVYITQIHEEGSVTLDFDIAVETFTDQPEGTLAIQVTSPDGKTYTYEERGEGAEEQFRIAITDPKLWWPHGYGDQPLYQVEVSLLSEDGKVLDSWKRRIGLRTITVNTDQDEWGNCFAHEVNGVKIFAMGADYIPEDNLLSRVTKERTGKLLRDAVWANHNCIRVWGGGYYPEDFLYGRISCMPVHRMNWMTNLSAISSQRPLRMSAESVIMRVLPCGVVTMRWKPRHWMASGLQQQNRKQTIRRFMNILYRRSVRQRIPRPFTGRLLRPQAEAMIIRGMRQEEMPITGTYGMERSRLPITESTISVIFPSSASSPSRALRRWRALPFRKSGIFSPE